MKAKDLLRKLNYLPRWAWYLMSLFVFGPFGPVFVYLIFHALEKSAADQEEQERQGTWDQAFRDAQYSRRTARSGRVYQDDDCTVRDETDEVEVNRRWEQTCRNAERARTQQTYEQSRTYQTSRSEQDAPEFDENGSVDDVLRDGNDALRRIRRANDIIADDMLSRRIDSIETSCGQIFSVLEQRPQLLPQLRTFLRYYLPTTLRLLEARAKLESGANTPKAREVRARIAEAIGVIDKALIRQVEALDEYRFIDLESEMDVLRDMLKADGLLDEDAPREEDPFAEVLGRGGAAVQSRKDTMLM